MGGGPGARLNAALAVLSFGIALATAEVVLGVWFRITATAAAPASILSEVLRLRAAGDHAYPKIPGNVLVDWNAELRAGTEAWHPITPAPGNATVLLCNENGPTVMYAADRYGFDNPDAVWDDGAPDVAVIGDSYTAGVCVDRGETLPARLRSSFEVLNLGTAGAGPLQELAILREYVAPLMPPVVVWVYYEGNDLWDLEREADRAWLRAYLEPTHSQRLMAHRDAIDARYRAWVDSLVDAESVAAGAASDDATTSFVADALRLRALRRVTRFGVVFPSPESPLGLLWEVLERARDDVAAWGGQLVLVYMPAYARYDTLVGEGVAGRRELLAFAEASGIPIIDLDPAFQAQGDPRALWMSPRAHLSPEGYALAAQAIGQALAGLPGP
ncbi:MAG: SGNH/GDSL hydrolase family protein [Gemmatimonadota bacterium]